MITIRTGHLAVAIFLMVVSMPVGAQTSADSSPCVRNQEACDVLGRDAAAASSPGGIGSKTGTGGGGTNALRPDALGNSTVTTPTVPKLPSLPRRFGF